MQKTQLLLRSVTDAVGLDYYLFFEEDAEKHDLTAAIAASVIAALITAYLKGLVNAEEVGKADGKRLMDLILGIKSGETYAADEIDTLTAKAREKTSSTVALDAAMLRLAAEIASAGVAPAQAQALAEKTAAAIRPHLASDE